MNVIAAYFSPPSPVLTGEKRLHITDAHDKPVRPRNREIWLINVDKVFSAIRGGHDTFLKIEDETNLSTTTIKKACQELVDLKKVKFDEVGRCKKRIYSVMCHA